MSQIFTDLVPIPGLLYGGVQVHAAYSSAHRPIRVVHRACLVCAKPYIASVSQLRRGRGITCSWSCANSLPRANRRPNVDCPYCGKNFHPPRTGQKFCSIACARLTVKRQPKLYPYTKHCVLCGSEFIIPRSSYRFKVTCSEECVSALRSLKVIQRTEELYNKYRAYHQLAPGPLACEYCGSTKGVNLHRKNGTHTDHRIGNLVAACGRCRATIASGYTPKPHRSLARY